MSSACPGLNLAKGILIFNQVLKLLSYTIILQHLSHQAIPLSHGALTTELSCYLSKATLQYTIPALRLIRKLEAAEYK